MPNSSKFILGGAFILFCVGLYADRSAYSTFQFSDVLVILAFALVVGGAVWIRSRLAPDALRNVKIFLMGAMACVTSAFLIWNLFLVKRILQILQSAPGNSQLEITTLLTLAAPALFFGANSIYWSCIFFRALQKRINKSD